MYSKTSYNNVEYKIHGIHLGSADTSSFESENGVTTIADYFASALNKPVQYPRAPLVRVGKDDTEKARKEGKRSKMKLFPMEFCVLNGAQKVKKMSENQIATLIRSCLTCK